MDQLSEEERDEGGRTHYINPQGAGSAVTAVVSALVLNPARCGAGAIGVAALVLAYARAPKIPLAGVRGSVESAV